jgi:hypothetical protein
VCVCAFVGPLVFMGFLFLYLFERGGGGGGKEGKGSC